MRYTITKKWDGSGYPYGLSKNNIPESARIVAIADVFDALTHQRAYKEAWSEERAFEEIKNSSGSHFDPKFVAHFFDIQDEIIALKNVWNDA